MDAIALIMVLFLNLSEPCHALPVEQQHLHSQTYQVLSYVCGEKVFKIWHRYCEEGQGYWSRPFFLQELTTGHGFYLDQFAEVHSGHTIDRIPLSEMYVPKCGT